MALTYAQYTLPNDDSVQIATDGNKKIYYVDHNIDLLKEYNPDEALGLVTDLVDDTVEDLRLLNMNPKILNDVDFDIMNKSCPTDKKRSKIYNIVKDRLSGMESKIYKPINGHIMFVPIKKEGQNNRLYINGQSGSGKSVLCGRYALKYQEQNPGNEVYLFSRKMHDPAYDNVIPGLIRVPLNRQFIGLTQRPDEGQNDPLERFANSLMIFDDIESIQNPDILNAVINFKNSAFQLGRQYNIDICSIQHKGLGGKKSIVDLVEANVIVCFPKKNLGETTKILKNYCLYNKHEMDRILDEDMKNERWMCVIRPNIIICENFIKVLN